MYDEYNKNYNYSKVTNGVKGVLPSGRVFSIYRMNVRRLIFHCVVPKYKFKEITVLIKYFSLDRTECYRRATLNVSTNSRPFLRRIVETTRRSLT